MMQMTMEGMWKDKSGKFLNPEKKLFFKLAADALQNLNLQRDTDGLSYARKAMIMNGFALNAYGM